MNSLITNPTTPLEACIRPLTANGFYLETLLEPKPVEKFKEPDLKHYRELNEFQAFMCLRAIRKTSRTVKS